MACSKSSRRTEGSIIKALDLDIVIDKILEHLPIQMAARTSVLSKQWRRGWLSLKSLVFDKDFYLEYCHSNGINCQTWSKIISGILFCHNGPVHDFCVYMMHEDTNEDCVNHRHWLSFLSKNGIKKITIQKFVRYSVVSSYIFCCSELEHLVLDHFTLKLPPTGFCGFRNLKRLDLINIAFAQESSFLGLVSNYSTLTSLKLESWKGMDHIVIDFPSLKTLFVSGEFKSIAFRNVCSLERITLSFFMPLLRSRNMTVELIDVDNLTSPCQLQSIEFNGRLCELLAAGGILRSVPVTFNYLNKLTLNDLYLDDFDVFDYVLHMLQSCPYITMLDISVSSIKDVGHHELHHNYSHQLARLLEIKIKGIKGSCEELELIKHLLAISVVLEKLSFTFGYLATGSELKITKALMRFPRASTKAQLVCLN